MDSILNSIKKMLGIDSSYTHFDSDIIMHINSVFMILNQIGLPKFSIEDASSEWSEYFSLVDETRDIESVKTYVFMKVRMMFDTPTGAVAESYKNLIDELEWRLNIEVDRNE